MPLFSEVKSNTYYDSVSLMVLSSTLGSIEGIDNAAVMMGTPHNIQLMKDSNLLNPHFSEGSSSDLIVAINYESEDQLSQAEKEIDNFFNNKTNNENSDITVKTLRAAIEKSPDSNLAIISVPGEYAAKEAMEALKNNKHVLLFSDNVSIEEEIELKDYAVSNNLLMMGPDCGTAFINGTALGFANNVRRGNIGIVAAAGTGLQEVAVLIDKLGAGISQGIGTGGRDLKDQVDGRMFFQGMKALENDEDTDIIVLVSKPPSKSVLKKIVNKANESSKQVIVCLLGGDYSSENKHFIAVQTLEDAANSAVRLSKSLEPETVFFSNENKDILSLIKQETEKFTSEQKYVRGIYSGGTLCYEGMLIARDCVGDVHSNVPLRDDLALINNNVSQEHTFVDMGEDEFTEGMPHPMIDTRLRKQRILKESQDENVAVILMDIVLGYGSHEDPVEEFLPVIEEAKAIAAKDGRYLSFVASVCGTKKDPQNLMEQSERLSESGVIVMPSNAQAARMACMLVNRDFSIEI